MPNDNPAERPHPKDQLHGVTLEAMLTRLVDKYGWDELARRIRNITTRGIAFDRGQTLTDVYHQRLPLYQRWAEVTVPVAPGEDVNHLAARLLAELGRLGPDAPREKPAL